MLLARPTARQSGARSQVEKCSRAPVHHLARHDDPLNLAGALPDSLYPKFAKHSLSDVLAHVTAAAEDLHRAVGHPARHLGAVQLGHRGLTVQRLAVMTCI